MDFASLIHALEGISFGDLARLSTIDFLNTKNGSNDLQLHEACHNGDLAAVQRLVASGASVNKRAYTKQLTPLMIAAKQGHWSILNYLVSKGASVNAGDLRGKTALYKVTQTRGVDLLVYYGAHVNGFKPSPLLQATLKQRWEVAFRLLKHGAKEPRLKGKELINLTHRIVTPLHYAAAGNVDCSKLMELLLKQIHINTQDADGFTPLHMAVTNGCLANVKFLVGKNANYCIRDDKGWTPLGLALKRANLDIARFFLECTPYAPSNLSDMVLDMIKRLIKTGRQNSRDSEGFSLIHWAALYGPTAAMESMVQLGANIFEQDNNNRTPLHMASARGHLDIMKLLVYKGAVDQRDRRGITALHLASQYGHIEAVEFLVQSGANPNGRDILGRTPVTLAMNNGHTDIVSYLLQYSPEVNGPLTSTHSLFIQQVTPAISSGIIGNYSKFKVNYNKLWMEFYAHFLHDMIPAYSVPEALPISRTRRSLTKTPKKNKSTTAIEPNLEFNWSVHDETTRIELEMKFIMYLHAYEIRRIHIIIYLVYVRRSHNNMWFTSNYQNQCQPISSPPGQSSILIELTGEVIENFFKGILKPNDHYIMARVLSDNQDKLNVEDFYMCKSISQNPFNQTWCLEITNCKRISKNTAMMGFKPGANLTLQREMPERPFRDYDLARIEKYYFGIDNLNL